MPDMLKRRPGFTLVEVLVALVLTAIIGAALTSVFVTQAMFFDTQEKVGSARGVSRSALNIMLSELRMIEPGLGVEDASSSHITVRAPYAMGVICNVGTRVTASMMPMDPAMFTTGNEAFSGYAYRTSTGAYRYVEDVTQKPASKQAATVCASGARPIRVIADGGGNLDGFGIQFKDGAVPTNPDPAVGNVVFMYQRITYRYKASTSVPGQIALFRITEDRLCSGVPCEEELVAPFASTARFRFYVSDAVSAVDAPPAPGALNTLTGLELVLDGLSERPRRDGSHQTAALTTSVFFKNRP